MTTTLVCMIDCKLLFGALPELSCSLPKHIATQRFHNFVGAVDERRFQKKMNATGNILDSHTSSPIVEQATLLQSTQIFF